jgi:hypothetical protein
VLGSFAQTTTHTALTSYYTIADRLLRIEADGAWVARWVATFLDGFHLRPATPQADRVAITLRVARAALPVVPSGLQTFAINHGVCHTDGTRYFLVVDESLILIHEPAAQLIEVTFGLSDHARHPIALVNAFSYGLQAALRRARVYDIHAAGVCAPTSDAGLLIVGGSGSGKSTLTLKLTARGWRYLSDDMLVLRETSAGLEALGLRRIFSLAPPSLAGSDLPRLDAALGDPVASDPTKRRFVPEIVFPEGRAESCQPRVLLFPQISNKSVTTLTPIGTRAAMEHLVRFCPWATYDRQTAPDNLRVLARLANQCRAYVMHAGRDLLLDQARAADLLMPYLSV